MRSSPGMSTGALTSLQVFVRRTSRSTRLLCRRERTHSVYATLRLDDNARAHAAEDRRTLSVETLVAVRCRRLPQFAHPLLDWAG
jgi:hypothetical protein